MPGRSRGSWAAVLAALLVAATWVPPSAQSLADVARAEAVRRAAIARSGPTLTNKDLGPIGPGSRPTADVEPRAGTAGPPAESAESDAASSPAADPPSPAADPPGGTHMPPPAPEKRDETYWRTRFAATRGAVARAEQEAVAVESRLAELDADLENGRSDARRAELVSDRESTASAVRQLRRRVANLRDELAALEQLARTLDVPPDWTR